MTGGVDSIYRKSISISGAVRSIGVERLEDLFAVNPYMADLYPTSGSCTALEVFCLYKGRGQFFDLSSRPITRESFSFGGIGLEEEGYFITDACNSCGSCVIKCPGDAVVRAEVGQGLKKTRVGIWKQEREYFRQDVLWKRH